MSSPPTNIKRLNKELVDLVTGPPPGITVDKNNISAQLDKWIVNLEGAPETLYEGEVFQLEFTFGARYPFESPQVVFVGNIPVHPHVYSNGHICLSILTEDWTPAMSVMSVCLSIVSMLSSCKEKKRPPDNSIYVRSAAKDPKKTRWWFHAPWIQYEIFSTPSISLSLSNPDNLAKMSDVLDRMFRIKASPEHGPYLHLH